MLGTVITFEHIDVAVAHLSVGHVLHLLLDAVAGAVPVVTVGQDPLALLHASVQYLALEILVLLLHLPRGLPESLDLLFQLAQTGVGLLGDDRHRRADGGVAAVPAHQGREGGRGEEERRVWGGDRSKRLHLHFKRREKSFMNIRFSRRINTRFLCQFLQSRLLVPLPLYYI